MTALGAIRQRAFLVGAWPWRSLAYLVTTGPVLLVAGVALGLLGLPWLLLLSRVVGWEISVSGALILLLLGGVLVGGLGPLVAAPIAVLERWRLRLVDTRPLPAARPWPATRPWAAYAEPTTWRELAYAVLLVTAGPVVYGTLL